MQRSFVQFCIARCKFVTVQICIFAYLIESVNLHFYNLIFVCNFAFLPAAILHTPLTNLHICNCECVLASYLAIAIFHICANLTFNLNHQ